MRLLTIVELHELYKRRKIDKPVISIVNMTENSWKMRFFSKDTMELYGIQTIFTEKPHCREKTYYSFSLMALALAFIKNDFQ